jgi:sulfur-oxidizing protein SoxY
MTTKPFAPSRRVCLGAGLVSLGGVAWPALAALVPAEAKIPDRPEASPIWQKVRASLFASRPIATATPEQLRLEAPARAVDGAVVPVAIRVGQLPAGRRVDRLVLVIDSNPSPISAIVQFQQLQSRADIETRVRVDDYSHVRAIAELDDGSLLMATRFVKAAGGCSAPAGADAAAALASLGRMHLQLVGHFTPGQPVQAQLTISHPNHSGLAMDQFTRHIVPAHFVRQIALKWRDQPVLSADVDFSISENPSLRFWFVPDGDGELRADVTDTQARAFSASFPVPPRP